VRPAHSVRGMAVLDRFRWPDARILGIPCPDRVDPAIPTDHDPGIVRGPPPSPHDPLGPAPRHATIVRTDEEDTVHIVIGFATPRVALDVDCQQVSRVVDHDVRLVTEVDSTRRTPRTSSPDEVHELA